MQLPAADAPTVEYALGYARRGWPVVALHGIGRGGRCTCGRPDCASPGKHPQFHPEDLPHGLRDATTDERTIRTWFARWPNANVGVRTGKVAGFVVLDVDPRHGGDDTLRDLERRHGALPDTPETVTGGGGRHLLFAHPGGDLLLRSGAGRLGDGLDLLADGGYIVAPPSKHVSSRRYAWELSGNPDETPLAPLPRWVARALRAPSNGTAPDPGGAGPIPEGQRNTTLTSVAGSLRRFGADPDTIFEAVRRINRARCVPPLDDAEVRAIADGVARYAPAPADPEIDLGGESVDPAPLPRIRLSVQDLRILTARSWDALLERNRRRPFLFRYGGAPVRVEHDETGRPVLRELTADRVVHELARAAEFLGWNQGAREWRITRPPRYVAQDVLATPDPPLPVVTRLTECPTFAPDGTLQTDGGYHPASLTYCAASDELGAIPAVSEAPSDAEVAEALRLFTEEVLGDFPFVSPADRANALGLGLLPYVRDLIPGPTPLHLFEAPVPGSGKGICIEALLRPSCGRSVGAVAQAGDDDEWRKRITAVLRDGHPAVLVDNVTKPLDSGSLAMALTAPYWTDRVLGASETVRLPVRCAWVASANNPTFSTEIARRTVRVRIDPRTDRPWERAGWRHPELLSWVDAHRPALVWAALTLARRWLARGRPRFSGRALGSYEQWTHVVGGVLECAGVPGFLGNAQQFYDQADTETAVWRQFVAAWAAAHGEDAVGVSELFPLALKADGIDLGNGSERSQRIRFGKALMRRRDRVVGDYRITQGGPEHGAARWALERAKP
jgi:hypothetical protein